MPNHCLNTLILSATTLPVILKNYIRKDEEGETIFDFERVAPIGDVPDWHEQRMKKWGTNRVGYNLSIGESQIDFYTAWTPPIPIIRRLAELHQDLIFRLEYSEPGIGFYGKAAAKWQNGEILLNDACWNRTDEDREEAEAGQNINYENLFEVWADFGDAEAPDEVTRLIETSCLGPVDAVSFAAFCYGYERASQIAKKAR
jgi:hypothetical protein